MSASRSSAAAPLAAPTAPGRAGRGVRPAVDRARLALVPPVGTPAPRTPFVLLVGTLLVTGLAGLLYLHTQLAEDSFRLFDLKTRSAELTDRQQALQQRVEAAAAPARLATKARALGMVASENPAFIRLSDGRVLGRPRPAKAPPAKAAVPASSPAPTSTAPSGRAGTAGADADAPEPSVAPSAGTGR